MFDNLKFKDLIYNTADLVGRTVKITSFVEKSTVIVVAIDVKNDVFFVMANEHKSENEV